MLHLYQISNSIIADFEIILFGGGGRCYVHNGGGGGLIEKGEGRSLIEMGEGGYMEFDITYQKSATLIPNF